MVDFDETILKGLTINDQTESSIGNFDVDATNDTIILESVELEKTDGNRIINDVGTSSSKTNNFNNVTSVVSLLKKCNSNNIVISSPTELSSLSSSLPPQPQQKSSSSIKIQEIKDDNETAAAVGGSSSNIDNLNDPELNTGNDKWWAASDSYNLTAFEQTNGVWPIGHPLPLPNWAPHVKDTLSFDNVWQYEEMNALIEAKLHRMLEETHYNTVNNFIDFYKAFKKTRRSDLKSFFQFYDIPINRRHHMCVSLAMEIVTRILEIFPALAQNLYIVSCEEAVVSPQYYIDSCDEIGLSSADANLEKEHALVAMKINIAGRQGIMILDPGYHVARAATVMKDQCYPHTGWFNQSNEKHCKRDYCYNYNLHNDNYIEWCEREQRADKQEYKVSLVYIEHPYRTAVDVTVRRNLVYDFRSLLARDAKGRVFAGIYFPVLTNKTAEQQFTLFYDGPNNQSVKAKLFFNIFKNPSKIPDHVTLHIEQLAIQLNINQAELLGICKNLAEIVTDQDFMQQVLSINDDINEMSADN